MFDIEQAVSQWRRRMLAAGIKAPATLDELESHLREDIRVFLSAGKAGEEAFRLAVARVGNPKFIRMEFNKVKSPMSGPVLLGSLLWAGATVALAADLLIGHFYGIGHFAGKGSLRSLLLCAHILTVTAGYLAVFLTGGFGIYYVCRRWFGGLSSLPHQTFLRAVSFLNPLSAGLVAVGFFLGMLWSKQHTGRYLQGDSREFGGLAVLVWLIACWALQRSSRVSDRTAMFMGLGGNIVVTLAWFGPWNFTASQSTHFHLLAIVAAVLGVHLCFLVMGMRPVAEVSGDT